MGLLNRNEKESREDFYRRSDEGLKEIKKERKQVKQLVEDGKIIPASKEIYARWLKGYIKKGGKPTHSYDYPFSRVGNKFYMAIEDFEIPPLHGSSSINLIVMKGVEVKGKDLGHSGLYFMDGFKQKGEFVPIYKGLI